MSHIHYKSYKGITLLARSLRRRSTSSEKILWGILRGKKLDGLKFLRQHPVFYSIKKHEVKFFIVDFYCASYRLIIELDGPIHDFQEEEDMERDQILNSREFSVLRIKNEELSNIESVLYKIRETIKSISIQSFNN